MKTRIRSANPTAGFTFHNAVSVLNKISPPPCLICCLRLQGSEPKLSYEGLEKAFMQERLENLNRQRANQQLQAKASQAEADAKKAVRVLTKGFRRFREHTSRVRLMETKLDRVARESNLLQLHDTLDEREEELQRAQEEVHTYKSKHWRSEVRYCSW